MEILCRAVFVPLAVVLLVLVFHDGARERVLNLRGIARLERRLTLSNKGYWVAFGLLLAVGAFVRCYRFLELPMGQNQDGSMAAVEALCLADNGTDQYGTSWPTYFEAWGYSQMSTLYSYLLIPFVRLFGLSKFTLRFPMLLMGLLTLPLMWDVARRIGGRSFALTALFLLALNPWHMVMSRWALEANMLPHVVLLAAELLLIGTRRRWALYLSMVVFGLAPYAYGLAAVSVPCILLPMAIFLTARKKVKPLDLAVCVAIFAAVSGPYYATMVINAFGLETMTLGRMTMPRFEKSQRINDISLGSPNPYLSMAQKLRDFLPTATGYYPAEGYSGIAWADTMYPFVIPAALYGWYRLCRDRRRLALRGSEEPLRDGGMLILVWMFAAIITSAGGFEGYNQTGLVVAITQSLIGSYGVLVLAIIVFFACLTTAIGLTSSCASYFAELTNNKVSYTKVVILTVAFSYIVSNFGISTIISIAAPILNLLYPVVLVMIVLNFFGKHIKSNNIYIFAAAFALVASAAEVLCGFGLPLHFVEKLPLGSFQCGWVVPAIVGGIIGKFVPTSQKAVSLSKSDNELG